MVELLQAADRTEQSIADALAAVHVVELNGPAHQRDLVGWTARRMAGCWHMGRGRATVAPGGHVGGGRAMIGQPFVRVVAAVAAREWRGTNGGVRRCRGRGDPAACAHSGAVQGGARWRSGADRTGARREARAGRARGTRHLPNDARALGPDARVVRVARAPVRSEVTEEDRGLARGEARALPERLVLRDAVPAPAHPRGAQQLTELQRAKDLDEALVRQVVLQGGRRRLELLCDECLARRARRTLRRAL